MQFRWLNKMTFSARRYLRVTKFLLAGLAIFCVSWLVCVSEWHGGVHWRSRGGRGGSTMRTIVAYSEGKQEELDRASLAYCDDMPTFPIVPEFDRTWHPNKTFEPTWQRVEGTKVSIYAAYFDQRLPTRYIRILASFEGRNISEDNGNRLYCQTRPDAEITQYVEAVVARPLQIWSNKWDEDTVNVETPLLLSCPVTDNIAGPTVISVVTEPCDEPTNALSVTSMQPVAAKRNFTICVKDMHFEKDVSQDIIEWIETNKLLGVDMIDMYIDKVGKENEKVLLHYRDKGYIRLFQVPIKDKLDRPLWQRRRDHVITYNDCLYRNIIESEFVVPLDIDEIVLPKIAHTWHELIERLKNNFGWDPSQNAAIEVQNVFFFDFMQGLHDYKLIELSLNGSKLYVKRDDVRIRRIKLADVGEIELESDVSSLSNEVVTTDEDKELYVKYKLRCGREFPVPKLERHIVRSSSVSPPWYYTKSLMLTQRVLTAFNHYPLTSIGVTTPFGWVAPLAEVQLNHYKESCNKTMVLECEWYEKRARIDRSALWMRQPLTRSLADAICSTNKRKLI